MSETAQLIFKFKTDAAVVVLVVALVVVVVAVDDVVALLVSVPLKQVHAFDGSLGVSCSKGRHVRCPRYQGRKFKRKV